MGMHDDAIERRTKLALDSENENQEQRLRKRRQMEAETKAHERELQKAAHEAKQLELLQERQTQLEHLASMHKTLSLSSEQLAAYLLASEQGPQRSLSRSSARTA